MRNPQQPPAFPSSTAKAAGREWGSGGVQAGAEEPGSLQHLLGVTTSGTGTSVHRQVDAYGGRGGLLHVARATDERMCRDDTRAGTTIWSTPQAAWATGQGWDSLFRVRTALH